MKVINNYRMSTRKWSEKDSLFFKFQGPYNASLKETATTVREIVEKHGDSGLAFETRKRRVGYGWIGRICFIQSWRFLRGAGR